jgi:excisionase family DNA binding protein
MTEELAYTVSETAQLLGISEWSLRRAIANGQLPSVRFGHRVVVPRYALERTLMELAGRASDTLEDPVLLGGKPSEVGQ